MSAEVLPFPAPWPKPAPLSDNYGPLLPRLARVLALLKAQRGEME